MNNQQFILFLFIIFCSACQTKNGSQNLDTWQPKQLTLETPWTHLVTPQNVHAEYPRPQMKRTNWINLNGLWDYAILPKFQTKMDTAQGQILVPFPIESSLSGVKKSVGIQEQIVYQREISIPKDWVNQRVLLHFEASDWETTVLIDGQSIGTHQGGYDPISFDLSDHIQAGETKELKVAVWDPSDLGHFNPRGKQVSNPSGIYYTPSSGIWQTVWLEPVPMTYIESLKIETNIDESTVSISTKTQNGNNDQLVSIDFKDQNGKLNLGKGSINQPITIKVNDPKLWSPKDPFLYDLTVKIQEKGETIDEVKSYFGMRKVDLQKDDRGFTRIFFNNKFLFQNGPLDQGFWPDGLYTAPTDEALRYDIEVTKKLGFNMLRKHVKIESRRFYYWCDKLGILVWQDMPNTNGNVNVGAPDLTPSSQHIQNFEQELTQMITTHYNHPSIIMWVPFNEGWGQHRSAGITDFVKKLDPTRLVNLASGWEDRGTGDIFDIHNYPAPNMPPPEENRAVVLGEFGGLGYPVENHMWTQLNWGYRKFENLQEMTVEYENYYSQVWSFADNGLSAAVYTQTTDIETETNGLMTYDRKVIKMNEKVVHAINTRNYLTTPTILPYEKHFHEPLAISIRQAANHPIYYTLDGSIPNQNSTLYDGVFSIEKSSHLQAISISKDGKQSQISGRKFQKFNQKRPNYQFEYSRKYTAGGDFALIDGKYGTQIFSDGKWQGFEANPLSIIFEKKEDQEINSIEIGFIQSQYAWIFFPVKVIVSISNDGKFFTEIGQKDFELFSDTETKIERVKFDINRKETYKYIGVNAVNISKVPDWHPGAGNRAWLFVDEISIK